MGSSYRRKMTPEMRAKQFQPFAALVGLTEALKSKEKIVVPKIELSEERREELDEIMGTVSEGNILKVVYFRNGEYLQITGVLSKIDIMERRLQIVNTRIKFSDIYDIEVLD